MARRHYQIFEHEDGFHVGLWHAGGRLISVDGPHPDEAAARARLVDLERADARARAAAERAR